jgi:phosphate uptake regulator
MARKSYSEQLIGLKENVLKMGIMVEEAIFQAVKSLKLRDDKLAQDVVDGDDAIDDLLIHIEDCCIRLLALQQPIAGDLDTTPLCFPILPIFFRINHPPQINYTFINWPYPVNCGSDL